MFKELLEDPFYEEYKKYPRSVVDYCILKCEEELEGIKTHQAAVLFAMNQWNKIIREESDYNLYAKPNEMKGKEISSQEFFSLPSKDQKIEEITPYWYLFLEPPHGNKYDLEDFKRINDILFPKGFDHLELIEWNVDWSNYFEDGLEWWGARCVSIYDRDCDRFVVIAASATD